MRIGFNVVVNGVSAFIELPERNYTGITMATALEEVVLIKCSILLLGSRLVVSDVTYNGTTNNLVFTTGTTGDNFHF